MKRLLFLILKCFVQDLSGVFAKDGAVAHLVQIDAAVTQIGLNQRGFAGFVNGNIPGDGGAVRADS